LGKYRRGKKKWTKEVGKIEKGRGILEEGIDLNSYIYEGLEHIPNPRCASRRVSQRKGDGKFLLLI